MTLTMALLVSYLVWCMQQPMSEAVDDAATPCPRGEGKSNISRSMIGGVYKLGM